VSSRDRTEASLLALLSPLALPGASTHHYLTCLDGLLTANKVARKFEFSPLRQRVLDVEHSQENRAKVPRARELTGMYRRGRVSALLEDFPCLIGQAVTRLLRLCLPKTLSGMTRGWAYDSEAADGHVFD
jgi:hypothetical protein